MPRQFAILALSLAVLGTTATGAFGGSDQETFAKFREKSAPQLADLREQFKPVVLCVCGLDEGIAGVVASNGSHVGCYIPQFTAGGDIQVFFQCPLDSWVPVTK